MSLDDSVLAVDCYSGKIPDSSVCACELVEEGSLAAVLVACERKGQGCAFWESLAFAFGVVLAFLAESWMFDAVEGGDEAFSVFCVA